MALTLTQSTDIEIKDAGSRFIDKTWGDSDRTLTNNEYTMYRKQVADGAADEPVDFAGIATANLIIISTDQELTYRLLPYDTEFKASNIAPTVLNTAGVTNLYLNNDSGSDANVTILIANLATS